MEENVQIDESLTSHDAEGVFAVDKPLKMSSQRAVQLVKFWARRETGNKKIKVGHGGTLDPLATGVLVIAVGRKFTREIDQHVAAQKEYEAEITLGMTSSTDDAEGVDSESKVKSQKSKVGQGSDVAAEGVQGNDKFQISNFKYQEEKGVGSREVEKVVRGFVGDIRQVPPVYSAIKIDGQEAYKRVRRGEEVEMKSRTVHIESIDILDYKYPVLKIRVVCGKGTYIRSLARDIGEELGIGAYLSGLVRTRVGTFTLDNAKNLSEFKTDPQ